MAVKNIPTVPEYFTKDAVRKLKIGCEAFWPFELLHDSSKGFYNTWEGWEKFAFLDEILEITNQESILDAYAVLNIWEENAKETIEAKGQTATVPQNLQELLEAQAKAKTAAEKATLAKNYQLFKQRQKEAPKEAATSEEPIPAPIRTPISARPLVSRPQSSGPTTTPGGSVSGTTGFYIGVTQTPSRGPFLLRQARNIANAPMRAFMSFGIPYLYKEDKKAGTEAALAIRGITAEKISGETDRKKIISGLTEGKVAGAWTQAAAAGLSRSQFNRLIEQLSSGSAIQASEFFRRGDWITYQATGEVRISTQPFHGSIYLSQSEGGDYVTPPSTFAGNFIQDIGARLFGRVAGSILKNVITGGARAGATAAGTGAAAGTAAGAATAAAGAAAGTALAPGVGTAIGFVVGLGTQAAGWFINKLKENQRLLLKLSAAALMLAGFFLGGLGAAILIPSGGLIMIAAFDPGFRATTASASGFAGALVYGVTHVVLASIAVPFAIAAITLPLLVAFIIFIINSSAFVIPGDLGQLKGGVVSPYVEVKKTANKTNIQNSELPVDVEYTIEISAKKGDLTNIRFDYLCDVIKENSNIACQITNLPDAPEKISQGSPFSFKYSHKYDSRYTDSLIVDTITVFADAPEKVGAKSEASASVVIGSPPQECPSIWPTSGVLAQGAYTNSSHFGSEAIDISRNSGGSVIATHGGVARVGNTWPWGKYVEIESTCGSGGKFLSRYAHLSVVIVASGARVRLGEQIGLVGNTGNSTGPHLHYEFRGPSGPKNYPNDPPFLMKPYVPKDLPRNCVEVAGCGNTSIP